MKSKIILFMVALLFFMPQISLAKEFCIAEDDISKDLEISALYPNPNTGEEEWIEIKNIGGSDVELAFYTIEDTTNQPYPLEGTLESGEKIKIEGFGFQLNNTDETVTLKTIAGDTVDTFSYTKTTKGESIEKISTEETSNDTTETAQDSEEETTEPVDTPQQTPSLWPIFSEAMPNPEGSDSEEEWIELYNPYGESLNLEGLKLDDEEEGSSPYELNGTLEAESYLIISIKDSKITLNNTVDHVRLLGVDDEILWDITYESTEEGKSYALIGSSYENASPTPGEENQADEVSEDQETQEDTTEDTEGYQNGDLSEDVEITEAYPNPEGPDQEEEWIELTNGGTVEVNLGNWILDDGPGGSDPYVIPDNFIIKPGQTLIIKRTESGIALNNSDETIQISDYNGELIDEISYETSEEGESYSQITIEETASQTASLNSLGESSFDIWEWTNPTPGEINPIWKQVKGTVEDFDGDLLTLFDGTSKWTFKAGNLQADDLLFKTGNMILVQASMENGLYKIMTSELLEGAKSGEGSHIPWGLIAAVLAILGLAGYEWHKKRQKTLHFDNQALN